MGQNKKVIYTCLVGKYDELRQPLVIDGAFDYVCFSNDIKDEKVGVWKIKPIPFESSDKVCLSRYVKLLPHIALREYEWSLWLDANIQITGRELYDILNKKIETNGKVFQVNHCIPKCDCVYEDMKFAYRNGRCGFFETLRQYRHLKEEGFPSHWGLFENNIILRRHNDPKVIAISELWWAEFSHYVKRDQFSLMYIYWKLGYRPDFLLDNNKCSRNVNFLNWQFHKHDIKKLNHGTLYMKWIERRDDLRTHLSSLFDYYKLLNF